MIRAVRALDYVEKVLTALRALRVSGSVGLRAEVGAVDAVSGQWRAGDVGVGALSGDTEGVADGAFEAGSGLAIAEVDGAEVDGSQGGFELGPRCSPGRSMRSGSSPASRRTCCGAPTSTRRPGRSRSLTSPPGGSKPGRSANR